MRFSWFLNRRRMPITNTVYKYCQTKAIKLHLRGHTRESSLFRIHLLSCRQNDPPGEGVLHFIITLYPVTRNESVVHPSSLDSLVAKRNSLK